MLKTDVTKMNNATKHTHPSVKRHHQGINSILWVMLRYKVHKLHCNAGHFQSAEYRLTTNSNIIN